MLKETLVGIFFRSPKGANTCLTEFVEQALLEFRKQKISLQDPCNKKYSEDKSWKKKLEIWKKKTEESMDDIFWELLEKS